LSGVKFYLMLAEQLINSKIESTRIFWRNKLEIPLDKILPKRWDGFDNDYEYKNFLNVQKFVSEENKHLVNLRCEGKWEKVTPSFYHEHYTQCLLRRRGVLEYYVEN